LTSRSFLIWVDGVSFADLDDFICPTSIERRFMCYQNNIALPADQFIHKNVLGIHVKMIGRLIQYKKIGFGE